MIDDPSLTPEACEGRFQSSGSLWRLLLGTTLVSLAVLGTIFIVPLLVFVGLLSYERYSNDRFFANVPVLAGQAGLSDEEAEKSFSETISVMFKVGSASATLQHELGQQGFQKSTGFEGFTNALKTERTAFPCRASWTVLWRENAFGAITAIKGSRVRYCL